MNINPLFSSVKLNEEGLTKVEIIRKAFTDLLTAVEYELPGNSREISIVKLARDGRRWRPLAA
jgi:hypothetical protein